MSQQTTATGDGDNGTGDQSDPTFKNDRMESAYYWAAQLRGFMNDETTFTEGEEYYIELAAGRPILVLRPEYDTAPDALAGPWVDHGFPTKRGIGNIIKPDWERRLIEADGKSWQDESEIRLFISPSDDRLQGPYTPLSEIDKSEYTSNGSFD